MRTAETTVAAITLWLKQVDRGYLHGSGWVTANKRFHALIMAARPYINQHFDDPQQQAAAFDGLTLALLTLAHFEDIETLATHLQPQVKPTKKTTTPQK